MQLDRIRNYRRIPDVEALKPYYQGLIDKYCPGLLEF